MSVVMKTRISTIVMMKIKEKIEKVGQKVNFNMSKKVSCLGFITLPAPLPPSNG